MGIYWNSSISLLTPFCGRHIDTHCVHFEVPTPLTPWWNTRWSSFQPRLHPSRWILTMKLNPFSGYFWENCNFLKATASSLLFLVNASLRQLIGHTKGWGFVLFSIIPIPHVAIRQIFVRFPLKASQSLSLRKLTLFDSTRYCAIFAWWLSPTNSS